MNQVIDFTSNFVFLLYQFSHIHTQATDSGRLLTAFEHNLIIKYQLILPSFR